MKAVTMLALMLGLVVALGVQADDKEEKKGKKGGGTPEARFAKADANSDGAISKDEFMAIAKDKTRGEKIFGKLDANGDGTLSKEEFAAFGHKKDDKGEKKEEKPEEKKEEKKE